MVDSIDVIQQCIVEQDVFFFCNNVCQSLIMNKPFSVEHIHYM